MKLVRPLLIGISLITIVACKPSSTTGTTAGSAASSESNTNETKNVLYRGKLEDAGVSIFMQGTHKLVLEDGRSILLESEAVNLDHYVDMNVEVFGAVRPTTEAGGMIMRVESVKSLEPVESSSSSMSSETSSEESSFQTSSELSSEVLSSEMSSEAASLPASSKAVASSSKPAAASSVAASSVSPAASSAPAFEASGELSAKATQMSKDKMGMEFWTQKYCSTHMGFCFPVHKNWWFNSFGATSTAVWHVEIGPSEISNLGEGPLTVRLVAGDVSQVGSDKQIKTEGGMTVGLRAWTNSRHFEIRGPAVLEAAIKIITENIVASGS